MSAAVANHLWHCTLFAVAAALVVLLLRSYQAKVRFWVWFAASVKFVIPFSMLMSFGAHTGFRSATRAVDGVSLASPAAVRMAQLFGPETALTPTYRPAGTERDRAMIPIAAIWIFGSFLIARKRWGNGAQFNRRCGPAPTLRFRQRSGFDTVQDCWSLRSLAGGGRCCCFLPELRMCSAQPNCVRFSRMRYVMRAAEITRLPRSTCWWSLFSGFIHWCGG
jgi:hypothetical protein